MVSSVDVRVSKRFRMFEIFSETSHLCGVECRVSSVECRVSSVEVVVCETCELLKFLVRPHTFVVSSVGV